MNSRSASWVDFDEDIIIRVSLEISQKKMVASSRLLSVAAVELGRIRVSSKSKILRPFFQRVETWELLLIVYALEGDGTYGIEDYLDRLQTLKFTRITMRNFIKDRIAEGSFFAMQGEKKSRKSLMLSDELRASLEAYFGMLEALKRNDAMAEETKIDVAFLAIDEKNGDV